MAYGTVSRTTASRSSRGFGGGGSSLSPVSRVPRLPEIGTYGGQAAAIEPIQPLQISAERDPNMDRYMGMFDAHATGYDQFRDELAEGIDQDAVNAMMRQRDLTSGVAKEAYEGRALQTGGDSGLASRARNQVLVGGARDASAVNAAMAATGRQAQLQALTGKGGAIAGGAGVASASASALAGQQGHALSVWDAQRAAQQAREAAAAAREQADWNRQMQLANMLYTG